MSGKYFIPSLIAVVAFSAFCLPVHSESGETAVRLSQVHRADTSFFAAIVRYATPTGIMHAGNPQRSVEVRIDPRILSGAYGLYGGKLEDHVQAAPSILYERRLDALRRLNVPRTDVVEDRDCVFTSGLPYPDTTDQESRDREESPCKRKGNFASIIFDRPQAAPDTSCAPEAQGAKDGEQRRCMVMRAAEFTPDSMLISALYVRKVTGGKWKVVGEKRLDWIFS